MEAAGEETDRGYDSETYGSSSWKQTRGGEPTPAHTDASRVPCKQLAPHASLSPFSSSADQSLRVTPWPLTSVLSQLSAATQKEEQGEMKSPAQVLLRAGPTAVIGGNLWSSGSVWSPPEVDYSGRGLL